MQQKWLILTSVACGTFMATLDSSIVNVALPTITSSLHTNLAFSRWVVIAYLFSITGSLLFFGKLADILGRKAIFNLGYLVFVLGSILCALSTTSITELIAFRGLQGIGAAMIMANGPAIITAAFPSNERGKALGILAMVVSLGLAIGPTIGGVLVHLFNWPSIFYVNVPVGILGAILVHKHVPIEMGMGSTAEQAELFSREHQLHFTARFQLYISKLRYFDWLGVILWIIVQVGYSLAIDKQNVLGLAGPLQRILSFGSGGIFLLFLLWEWSIKDPVLDMSLFKSRIFLSSNLSGFFNFVAISAVTLLMPFYFQNVLGLHPHEVGLLMTIIPLTIFFVAPISGRLSDTHGSRILSTMGMSLICFSMASLASPWNGLTSHSIITLSAHLALIGAGVGLFQSPNNNAIMGAVTRKHLGIASALLATVRNFGLVTGAALSTTLLMFFYGKQENLHEVKVISAANDFVVALRYTFLTLAIICSVAIITSLTKEEKITRAG